MDMVYSIDVITALRSNNFSTFKYRGNVVTLIRVKLEPPSNILTASAFYASTTVLVQSLPTKCRKKLKADNVLFMLNRKTNFN